MATRRSSPRSSSSTSNAIASSTVWWMLRLMRMPATPMTAIAISRPAIAKTATRQRPSARASAVIGGFRR
jgi:hypothetical protein